MASGYRPTISKFVPEGVADLIRQCWEHDPAERPTAAELLARLQALGGSVLPAGVPSRSLNRSVSAGPKLLARNSLSTRFLNALQSRASVM